MFDGCKAPSMVFVTAGVRAQSQLIVITIHLECNRLFSLKGVCKDAAIVGIGMNAKGSKPR